MDIHMVGGSQEWWYVDIQLGWGWGPLVIFNWDGGEVLWIFMLDGGGVMGPPISIFNLYSMDMTGPPSQLNKLIGVILGGGPGGHF